MRGSRLQAGGAAFEGWDMEPHVGYNTDSPRPPQNVYVQVYGRPLSGVTYRIVRGSRLFEGVAALPSRTEPGHNKPLPRGPTGSGPQLPDPALFETAGHYHTSKGLHVL